MTISRDAVIDWLKTFADVIAQNKDYLTSSYYLLKSAADAATRQHAQREA